MTYCTPILLGICFTCTASLQPRGDHAPSHAPADTTILLRFPPPAGFSRASAKHGSFADFLRHLPVQPPATPVRLYDGSLKARQDAHAAVIAVSVNARDLQQCADAIMRLRAEHLFATGRPDEIAFDFTNGFRAEWKRWRKGERIRVDGNTCRWVPGGAADASHDQLLQYLDVVFTYAGTRSLQRELARGPQPGPGDLDIGDVFIQGGSPGHAVIVVDKASDSRGRTAFLLAQGYMPAQEMHVLRNLHHPELGAWFMFEGTGRLFTPEWTFDWSDRWHWP